MLREFGYLKKYRNRRLFIDSRDPIIKGGKDALAKDYTEIFKEFSARCKVTKSVSGQVGNHCVCGNDVISEKVHSRIRCRRRLIVL